MRRWIIGISILVVIGALAYAFYFLMSGPTTAPSVVEETRSYSVSFDTSYEDGTYTIEGTVLADTACQQASATASVVGSGIRVDVVLPPDEGICLQRPETLSFSVDVEAPEDAAVAVFVNGTPATIQ